MKYKEDNNSQSIAKILKNKLYFIDRSNSVKKPTLSLFFNSGVKDIECYLNETVHCYSNEYLIDSLRVYINDVFKKQILLCYSLDEKIDNRIEFGVLEKLFFIYEEINKHLNKKNKFIEEEFIAICSSVKDFDFSQYIKISLKSYLKIQKEELKTERDQIN